MIWEIAGFGLSGSLSARCRVHAGCGHEKLTCGFCSCSGCFAILISHTLVVLLGLISSSSSWLASALLWMDNAIVDLHIGFAVWSLSQSWRSSIHDLAFYVTKASFRDSSSIPAFSETRSAWPASVYQHCHSHRNSGAHCKSSRYATLTDGYCSCSNCIRRCSVSFSMMVHEIVPAIRLGELVDVLVRSSFGSLLSSHRQIHWPVRVSASHLRTEVVLTSLDLYLLCSKRLDCTASVRFDFLFETIFCCSWRIHRYMEPFLVTASGLSCLPQYFPVCHF